MLDLESCQGQCQILDALLVSSSLACTVKLCGHQRCSRA